MAKRPIAKKRAARMRKALTRRPLDSRLDLRQWLISRGYAQTIGQADALILAGRVKSESHVLGIGRGMQPKAEAALAQALGRTLTMDDFEEVDVVKPWVDAKLRDSIQVHAAPSVDD